MTERNAVFIWTAAFVVLISLLPLVLAGCSDFYVTCVRYHPAQEYTLEFPNGEVSTLTRDPVCSAYKYQRRGL